MVLSTLIARVADGLPLAASMDDEEPDSIREHTAQAKLIVKGLSQAQEQRCSIESPPFVFHYMIEFGICYLTLTEKSYPKKQAFMYLAALQSEFHAQYAAESGTAARPYAFVKFDACIQRLKKAYRDGRGGGVKGIDRVEEDIGDVRRIMTRNIQDVLGRGKALEDMSTMSQNLSAQSKLYLKDSRHLNLQALYQKYGPPLIVLLVVVVVLYIRYWLW